MASLDFHSSARKHGISDEDIAHAVENALVVFDLGNDEGPPRLLHLGPDQAGNLLEVVVLVLDDGRTLAIHAMKLRPIYRDLLPN